MTNKEFITLLAEKNEVSPNYCQKMMNDLGDAVVSVLDQENSEIVVAGLGNFEIKKKSERIMVNPSTGKKMLVPPRLTLVFKMSPSYKNKIN